MSFSSEALSILGLLFSFALVYLSLPRVAMKLRKEGIVGRDMLKRGEIEIPESGGIIIVLSAVTSLSVVVYLFTDSYDGVDPTKTEMQVWMLSAVATILAVAFIGLVDDYLNIPQKYKVILPAFAALPLAFGFFRRTLFWLPFIGYMELGILYPLLIIPIGITAAANLTNMYAGLNGLEIGSGLITCTFTCLAAVVIGRWSAVIILAPMIGALAAFLLFNKMPAKIFPGDVGTLPIGAALAVASIVGRIKIIAMIALVPQIVNFLLYLVSIKYFVNTPGAKFARVRDDGTLEPPDGGEHGSLYFATMHLFRRGETWHVYLNWAFCIIAGAIALAVGVLIYGSGVSEI